MCIRSLLQRTFQNSTEIRFTKALNAWKRAAGQNFAAARLKVGDYYWFGRGVDVDYIEAAEHYRRAADETDSRASAQLGLFFGKPLQKSFFRRKKNSDSFNVCNTYEKLMIL